MSVSEESPQDEIERLNKEVEKLRRLYGLALDEVYALRAAAAREALVIKAHLDFATIPKTRRSVMTEEIRRLSESALGHVFEAYRGTTDHPKGSLRRVSAPTEMTRFNWEAERKERQS